MMVRFMPGAQKNPLIQRNQRVLYLGSSGSAEGFLED